LAAKCPRPFFSSIILSVVLKNLKTRIPSIEDMKDHSTWNNTRDARHAATVLQELSIFQ
jgi:hypothetical protein